MSKKALTIIFASALLTGFVACGQSEEERVADSAEEVEVVNETESTGDSLIRMMERENFVADSMAKVDSAHDADSIAAIKK